MTGTHELLPPRSAHDSRCRQVGRRLHLRRRNYWRLSRGSHFSAGFHSRRRRSGTCAGGPAAGEALGRGRSQSAPRSELVGMQTRALFRYGFPAIRAERGLPLSSRLYASNKRGEPTAEYSLVVLCVCGFVFQGRAQRVSTHVGASRSEGAVVVTSELSFWACLFSAYP